MASSLEWSEIIDISPMVSKKIAVYPGDKPFEENFLLEMSKGDNFTLSSIHTTVHLGAHTDAPNHYHPEGESIEKRDLSLYMGAVQVIQVDLGPGERIKPEHLKGKNISAPRVLFKTLSFPDPNKWNSDFVALSPELIDFLSQKKVKLVGLDTPSVDLSDDKELLTHHRIYEKNMAILEGVVLNHVSEGIYHLIALPLKIEGADATPVRAVLLR
ncbi:MAG: cyclase family protein [Bdellovibrionota bacterium]